MKDSNRHTRIATNKVVFLHLRYQQQKKMYVYDLISSWLVLGKDFFIPGAGLKQCNGDHDAEINAKFLIRKPLGGGNV